VALTPVLIAGLASLGVWLRGQSRVVRAVVALAVVACLWWNVGLMIQFGLNRMDRQRLTLGENAWTTFAVLPVEAPGIAWRYLAHRESFYNLPHQ
jgi:hypothetical protein